MERKCKIGDVTEKLRKGNRKNQTFSERHGDLRLGSGFDAKEYSIEQSGKTKEANTPRNHPGSSAGTPLGPTISEKGTKNTLTEETHKRPRKKKKKGKGKKRNPEPTWVTKRAVDENAIHEMIVPEVKVPIQEDANENFLDEFVYFHGYLDQLETRRFIRRSGDYLIRKAENDDKTHVVFSVGELLTTSKPIEENRELQEKGDLDEPIRVEDYIVLKNELGYSIHRDWAFENLEDLIVFYVFHPELEKLSIQLRRGIPRRLFEFGPKDIEKISSLGTGTYGDVYLAELSDTRGLLEEHVAVKCLRSDNPNLRELSRKLMQEGRILMDLHHPNIIRMLGWMIMKQPIMLVIEFMPGGALDIYLLNHFIVTSTTRLLKFAFQAALGLEYLHDRDIIHRDVSARNCLLASNGTLKLADFGLAVQGDFHIMEAPESLPTRYLAPENLSVFVFVTSSDCYSFGNLLYEIFSGGAIPYEEFTSAEAKTRILDGVLNSMDRTRAPPEVAKYVVESLWAFNMLQRPTMADTVTFLEDAMKNVTDVDRMTRTGTADTEEAEVEPEDFTVPEPGPIKRAFRRSTLNEELCPTQEETVSIRGVILNELVMSSFTIDTDAMSRLLGEIAFTCRKKRGFFVLKISSCECGSSSTEENVLRGRRGRCHPKTRFYRNAILINAMMNRSPRRPPSRHTHQVMETLMLDRRQTHNLFRYGAPFV
ncbi:unnamed protein product [Caenorhabditis auriculariae]|uniref:Tyrosine-protein kinase n=1 Tax=Caenorhabditis auriculariae TaxID=2777116 RepID=A0A8S1HHT4_9PELO|nr:unnamed protein product [Caenorhabditis auriculariae]